MNKTIKKVISVTAAATLLGTSTAFAAELPVNVMAGGNLIPTIVNDYGVFIPLRAVGEAIGYEVSWNNDEEIASLSRADGASYDFEIASKDDFSNAPVLVNDSTTYIPLEYLSSVLGERYTVDGEVVSVSPSAVVTVVGVSTEEKTLLVNDPERGEVVVYVTDETEIETALEGVEASFDSMKEGSLLKVYYSEAMTLSLPPQARAVAVEILSLPVNIENSESVFVFEGEIETVGENEIILSPFAVMQLSDETNIHHYMNKMRYTAADLEVGMKVSVTYSVAPEMLALDSIHGVAAEIEILGDDEEGNQESVSFNGTVKEVSEDGVLISEENYGEIMLLVSEATNVHHYMNKMFYTVSDLEEGMNIEAVCSKMMTRSIPPQVNAYEIIITD